MPPDSSQPFLRELDMNGAQRYGRLPNVDRSVRAGARSKLWPAAVRLRTNLDLFRYRGAAADAADYCNAFPMKGAQASSLFLHEILQPKAKMGMFLCRQSSWPRGVHLRHEQAVRWVRLRRNQPNQSNSNSWLLAAMNMTIRGLPRRIATTTGNDFNFGNEPANSFTQDQQPEPPRGLRDGQPALQHQGVVGRQAGVGRPLKIRHAAAGECKLAWLQHMLHHLAPDGSLALLIWKYSTSSDLPDRISTWEN